MHKRLTKHNILDAELKKYLGNGTYKTLSELKSAREAYLESDLFLNKRRKIIAHPMEIDIRLEHIRYIDEVELAVEELMKDVKKDVGIRPNDLLNIFHIKFLEAAKLFPVNGQKLPWVLLSYREGWANRLRPHEILLWLYADRI